VTTLKGVEPFDPARVQAAYDAAAEDYASAFGDDLDRLPVDRAVLDRGADQLRGRGPVLDIGCGPGQVASYLAGRRVSAVGLDLAPGMLAVALRTTELPLACADMRRLPIRSGSCAGVVAFYSIQHVRRAAIDAVFGEFARVLIPDGLVIVATHLGEGEAYPTELLGHAFDAIGGTFYAEGELEEALARQSFTVEDTTFRDPLPHEHQARRIYLTARRVRRGAS